MPPGGNVKTTRCYKALTEANLVTNDKNHLAVEVA